MFHGSEYWTTAELHMHKMTVADMRMLRCMCDKMRKNKIRNKRNMTYEGVVLMEDKTKEMRLVLFGHMKRRSNTISIQNVLDW